MQFLHEHALLCPPLFLELKEPIVFPVQPCTRQKLDEFGLDNPQSKIRNLQFIDPVGYLDMLVLEQNARLILTDSGGMQKEAYFFGVSCVEMRTETECVEIVETGWNVVVGAKREKIVEISRVFEHGQRSPGTLRRWQGGGEDSPIPSSHFHQTDSPHGIVKLFHQGQTHRKEGVIMQLIEWEVNADGYEEQIII